MSFAIGEELFYDVPSKDLLQIAGDQLVRCLWIHR